MPTYMDRHDGVTVTPDELAAAHALDVEVQAKHGVNYLSYWYDRDAHSVFCFVDAPSKEAAEAVHREAHGLVANRIIEVEENAVVRFLGGMPAPAAETSEDTAFRTILFTDIVGSTDLTQRLGDAKAMELVRAHDLIVRGHLAECAGTEVKHTGDGIMASFPSVARAIDCAIAIQQAFDKHGTKAEHPILVRIGVSAGEPVTEGNDLFGAAVQLAARACNKAAAGAILTSTAVRELCVGKGFNFEARGPFELKGFEELVPLYEVNWRG